MTHYLAETIMSSSSEESTSSFKSSPDLNDLKKNDVSVSNKLNDSWTLWAHLPHDIDWSVKSYKPILTFSSVEEAVALCETLPN